MSRFIKGQMLSVFSISMILVLLCSTIASAVGSTIPVRSGIGKHKRVGAVVEIKVDQDFVVPSDIGPVDILIHATDAMGDRSRDPYTRVESGNVIHFVAGNVVEIMAPVDEEKRFIESNIQFRFSNVVRDVLVDDVAFFNSSSDQDVPVSELTSAPPSLNVSVSAPLSLSFLESSWLEVSIDVDAMLRAEKEALKRAEELKAQRLIIEAEREKKIQEAERLDRERQAKEKAAAELMQRQKTEEERLERIAEIHSMIENLLIEQRNLSAQQTQEDGVKECIEEYRKAYNQLADKFADMILERCTARLAQKGDFVRIEKRLREINDEIEKARNALTELQGSEVGEAVAITASSLSPFVSSVSVSPSVTASPGRFTRFFSMFTPSRVFNLMSRRDDEDRNGSGGGGYTRIACNWLP